MIISASRRTDIPAFYAKWLLHRIESGFCTVPNPFNKKQISRISLTTEDVDAFVFWSRHPRPMFASINRLGDLGYHFYFMISILGYPRQYEPNGPDLKTAIVEFQELSSLIGPRRVIWRYDPIVLSSATDAHYHMERFHQIAEALCGYTNKVIISLVDVYRKNRKKLATTPINYEPVLTGRTYYQQIETLLPELASLARSTGMSIQSCAEEKNLRQHGIEPGKCIDNQLIAEVFKIDVLSQNDQGQRPLCHCVRSTDIGMYNSCPFGCIYCYATANVSGARRNLQAHNPDSPSILGWYE